MLWKLRLSVQLALVLILLLTADAHAAMIDLPIGGLFRTTYSAGRSVSIPQFNGQLGTLQSVTIAFTPEYSGTVSGNSAGTANSPNGWAAEFSGTIRLAGAGFGTLDFPLFNSRSGTVFQPGTPVFETFGPTDLSGSTTFTSALASYVGSGQVGATLSWPTFTGSLFWSRGGTSAATRDLGAVGGTVTYEYTPVPEPTALAFLGSMLLTFRRRR